MSLKTFIYRHRLVAKQSIALLARVLPTSASRRLRALAERVAFSFTPQYQSETLPAIFNYWSEQFLTPDAQRLGIDSPEAFFLDHIQRTQTTKQTVRVLSVGTGACSMEICLAKQLQADGVTAQITCADFNPTLMHRAATTAKARGVVSLMTFKTLDCNLPFELGPQDVIIVNQFFHHVTELETFCRSLCRSLAPHGVLVSSDIIGRNGHLLWPDVEAVVQQIWATLPAAKRHDRHFNNKVQAHYRPINHAAYSNEGVRAQDIVACLMKEFDFELFFSFGAVIVPFVERRVGFNFDPQHDEDRALIEHIQAIDAAALAAGRYPAANMIATLRHKSCTTRTVFEPISPEQHVTLTLQQHMKTMPIQR